VVVVFRDQDVAEKVSAGHASLDRRRRRRLLDNLLASPATLLQPGNLQHLELGTDKVEEFVDVLAEQTKLTATIRTGVTRIENTAFSRQMSWQLLATALLLVLLVPVLGLVISAVVRFGLLDGAIGPKIFERQFQLIDLTL